MFPNPCLSSGLGGAGVLVATSGLNATSGFKGYTKGSSPAEVKHVPSE